MANDRRAKEDEPIPPGIVYEIAPVSALGTKSQAIATLHRLLVGDLKALHHNQLGEALVLAAGIHRFAACLLGDLGAAPAMGGVSCYRAAGRSHPASVAATALTWLGLELGAIRPLPRARAFCSRISYSLVRTLLAWAPPVVVAADRHGHYAVVANHVSAVLARYRCTGEAIDVRVVDRSRSRTRALPEVCQSLVAVLAPICECTWQSVAAGLDRPADAMLLTGRSRAQVFRIRRAMRADDGVPRATDQ